MQIKQIAIDKPETVILSCKSAESSATIPVGSPVALVLNATDDGLAVVLPATAAAAKAHTLSFGVATAAIAAGKFGNVQAYGFCRQSKIVRATRSATDANWASTAAGAVGDPLIVDTVANALVRQAIPSSYVTGTAGTDTLALNFNMFMPKAVLAETIVSATTVASSLVANDTRTVSTSLVKTFLRML